MLPTTKSFSMSYADLCMLASNFVVFMTRDQASFTPRGVTTTMVTAFHTLADAFAIFPPDEYYLAAVSGEVEAKKLSRSSCSALIQLISGFFEQKWGLASYQYKQLRIKSISTTSDNVFLVTCRNVVTVATEYLADLTAIGLTQINIDDLEAEAQLFENKLNTIASKKAIRDSKSRERIEKGNELYSFCAQYSKIGKLIWENVDEAKYRDYIIYKTTHPVLSKPQNMNIAFIPTPSPTANITWDAVIGATNYDIYVSIVDLMAPSGEYNLLNNSLTNSYSAIAVINKRNYYKVKAKNDSQTSDYSDEVFIDTEIV